MKVGVYMSDKSKVEEILIKGMYGEKQIKIEERNLFLGTIRERIELALTTSQVMKTEIYPEFKKCMSLKNISILLNGTLSYSALSKYIQEANKNKIPFSLINNLPIPTPIGLVVTYQSAIDKSEIFVKDTLFNMNPS
jgi:uncharacterized protein YueI